MTRGSNLERQQKLMQIFQSCGGLWRHDPCYVSYDRLRQEGLQDCDVACFLLDDSSILIPSTIMYHEIVSMFIAIFSKKRSHTTCKGLHQGKLMCHLLMPDSLQHLDKKLSKAMAKITTSSNALSRPVARCACPTFKSCHEILSYNPGQYYPCLLCGIS